MSDIIRLARAMYGPAYDDMAAHAGAVKQQYVQAGGNPDHVYSPERVQAMMAGGPAAAITDPSRMRDDGSIAGPYVPPQLALATNMIEPRAVPAVLAALNQGIHTVSSGYDQDMGVGYAIGSTPDGQVAKVQR